mmetsp:Transcript_111919/g.321525  ORF Transcript_111919/g.321525 Transcript_111919/m.321525 type:complete len:515 (+) Transcript_111919:167-1711(+)
MHKYRLISKKGEGTFSEVLKAQSIKSGKHVAIKCMKNHFDSIDQVNNLREIQALRRLAGHPNIIKLHEVLYDEPTGRLALVFELMDMNVYEAIKGRRHYLPEQKVKHYMYEMLKALDYMHRNGIFHRDVKPENLLLCDDEIKLADLGSCRGIYSRQPFTEYISTRWYRAPECLLTDGYYNFKMDLFAAGCVCFEIVALFPLFPGQNEMDQIQKIHNVLGTPPPELLARKFKRNASHMDFNFPEKRGTGIERLIPHADADLIELMKKLIKYDPDERILARQALKDPYFRELREAEKELMSAVAPLPGSSGGQGSRGRDPSLATKAGLSSSSSAASAGDHGDAPEVTQPHEEERTTGLPNIRHQEQRRKGGGGGGGNNGAESGDDTHDDGMVLPPIGGLKGKRGDSKVKTSQTQTFKAAANASLQKVSMGASGHLGVLGGNTSTSMSSTDAMSSTNPHSWAGTKDIHDIRGVSAGSGKTTVEKMNSTWAPNQHHQGRRYVSPSGAKLALGGGKPKR